MVINDVLVFPFSVDAGDKLVPPRPHVVGDALADLGTVVKISLAHWPGVPARQFVAAKNGGKEGGETQDRLDSIQSLTLYFLLWVVGIKNGFSVWGKKTNDLIQRKKMSKVTLEFLLQKSQ